MLGLPVTVAAIAMVWASSAQGSDVVYLPILAEEYGYQGNCTVCHEGPFGGADTITKPFGQKLMSLGLVGMQNTDSLRQAMLSLPEDHDSDEDGHSDLDELALAGDPNDPKIGPGGFSYVPIEYGCSVVNPVGHPGRSRDANPLAFMLSTLIAGILLLDRRRRLRRSA